MGRIRHIGLFRWKEGVDDAHIARTIEALREMPEKVPVIRSYSFGPNVGVNPGTFDFGVTAEFDSVDDYVVYRDHPHHKAFIATHTADWVTDRASIQLAIQ